MFLTTWSSQQDGPSNSSGLSMSDNEIGFNTQYLNDYLRMVEDTESPRLFHVWQAVFNISCSLGRRCWFPFGPMNIYPNHYILLVGTPGTRKSTVAAIGKKILKAGTGVRFGPQDTAGQRQGIVAAMQNESETDKLFLNGVEVGARDNTIASLGELEQVTDIPESEEQAFISEADKHHIAVVASEFSRFIGQNNLQMLDFLTTMWDGDDYEYQLKSSKVELKNPLINLVGCTTPTSIANSMPPAAGGQGFLSRIILVYGARKYKLVPRPSVPDVDLVKSVENTLNDIYYQMHGAFGETKDARSYSESLYDWKLEIADSRFGYYSERRYTHLIKLAMCLCAANGRREIVRDDYEEAHRILRATEKGMPDALGEFGMNPLAALKQEIIEELRGQQGPTEVNHIMAMFSRDAKTSEISEVLNDMKRIGLISMTQQKTGGMLVSANFNKQNIEDAMLKMLKQS